MDQNIYTSIPAKTKIKNTYQSYHDFLFEIMNNIHTKLRNNIKLTSQPTYKARIKSFDSYYKKILRQHPEEAANSNKLVTLTDMMGIRIICTFLEDVSVVQQQIGDMFDVK